MISEGVGSHGCSSLPHPVVLRQNFAGGHVGELSALIRRQSQLDDHPTAPPASPLPVPLRRPPPARPGEPRLAPAARRVQENDDPAETTRGRGPPASQRADQGPRHTNGRGESPVGCPQNPRRAPEARHRRGRAHRLPPAPERRTPPSQSWRTFLTNHVRDLISIDFFTVPTAGLRVLFVLVLLAHDRRRVLHFNVTEHPTAAWTAQQIVDAFPDDSAPSYLLRDRAKIYGPRSDRAGGAWGSVRPWRRRTARG